MVSAKSLTPAATIATPWGLAFIPFTGSRVSSKTRHSLGLLLLSLIRAWHRMTSVLAARYGSIRRFRWEARSSSGAALLISPSRIHNWHFSVLCDRIALMLRHSERRESAWG